MVFLNGGFAAAQVACLETLRNALMSEENGNLENAAKEAEWVFEDIMQGGVQGLLDPEDREQEQGSAYGTVEIGHIPSDVESISEKMERKGRALRTGNFERELYPHQLADIITPELTPDNTPKIPEVAEVGRSGSPHKDRKPRVVSGPRNPTPEEIAAGIEICKASMAVRVRGGSNASAGPTSGYSPPPSPPIVRTEFLLGNYGSREALRKRSESMPSGVGNADSEKPKGSRRKDREDNFTLPPIESMYSAEIPTPPSSAKAIPDASKISHFPLFSDKYQSASAPELTQPESRVSTRPSSPTPSSTADISGATILPSPRYLSGGFDAPPQFFKEPVDPLFPSVGENLVIYFPSPDTQKSDNSQFLEKVLGDFAVSFTPQTPGVSRSNPHVSLLLKGRSDNQQTLLSPITTQFNRAGARDSFQSATSSVGTPPWSFRSSLGSPHPDPPLSSIPTITATAEKSPADIQNEFRAIMRHHFPPVVSPSPTITKAQYSADDDEDEDEDMRWLTEDSETDRIWRPVLSAHGINEDPAYSAIDLIVAVAAEEDGETIESRKGLELRRRLIEQVEEMVRKKGKTGRKGQVGLKYLLSNTLPQMRAQHPGTRDNTVLKGHFLLPELERYLSFNPQFRVLVIEFDFYTGSSAILELQRILGSNVDVLKVACVADAVTQFTSKPLKTSKSPKAGTSGIRIRTSMGATTTSYTFGPGTPTTPTTPTGRLQLFPPRKSAPAKLPGKQRPWGPKQRLISRADVVIPPFATVSSGLFIDAIGTLHTALQNREKMTGFYGESKDNRDQVPATPGVITRRRSMTPPEKEPEREVVSRQDTSYYLEDETDEEDCPGRKRASFRSDRIKAFKWLGLR